MLQTCIAKGNGIELLQASCTAITRYLLALSCKCCSSRRFPFQLVQVKRTLPAPHRTRFDGKRLQHEPAGVALSSVRILRKGVWGKPAGGSPGAQWFLGCRGGRVVEKMGLLKAYFFKDAF